MLCGGARDPTTGNTAVVRGLGLPIYSLLSESTYTEKRIQSRMAKRLKVNANLLGYG